MLYLSNAPLNRHCETTAGLDFTLSHPQDTRTSQVCNPQVIYKEIHRFFNLKGIFSDSTNIFLWYESEDTKKKKQKKKKSLFPKFQLIPVLCFQNMHDYVCFNCSHRLLCWIKSRVRDFPVKMLSFHTEMISAQLLWGNVLLRGVHHKYAKKITF